jgi:transcription factor AP-4
MDVSQEVHLQEEDAEYGGEGGAQEPPQEKRIRREIANSNERRRMQSINSGFASLRTLLPHHEGEKLSKAAILQQTAEYIYSLEQEKTRLLSQNCQLKRLIGQTQHVMDTDETDSSPAPKRRIIDMGQKVLLEEEGDDMSELQNQLERERRARMGMEERVRMLEGQLQQGGQRAVTQRQGVIQRYSVDERLETMESMELMSMGGHGQTILTAAAKKQGMETLVLEQHDGGRVEVERIPELPHEQSQTVEIANVQDPETGATRQYILTNVCDSTSKQNLETIVEAIRHLEGDHLFSEESGPHQVVKEEVVESCIIDDGDMEIQMTLASPGTQVNYTSANIIHSLPQVRRFSPL